MKKFPFCRPKFLTTLFLVIDSIFSVFSLSLLYYLKYHDIIMPYM